MGSGHRPMERPLLFLLLIVLFLLSLPFAKPDIASDRAALLAFRAAVGRSALPWNASDSSPCKWQGVFCKSSRVTGLRLPGTSLIGQIPSGSLGNLTELQTLSLRFNALSGFLPSDLAACSQLRNLYLQGNRFSGNIPASVYSLQNLIHLNLADNSFSGEISPAVNNLTHLIMLYLENNRLSGEIADINLPNIAKFNISFNQVNGSIPAKLQTQPSSSFLGTSLCGGPLAACPGHVSPAPAPENSGGSKNSNLSSGAIAGIAIGSAIAFLVVVILVVLLCRRKRSKNNVRSAEVAAVPKPPESEIALTDKRVVDGGIGNGTAAAAVVEEMGGHRKRLVFFGRGPRVYDLEDLLRASAEVLGKGTFGTAYKAVLEMGVVVAVKRLKEVNLPEREFRERIGVIGSMDHQNLVPLQAYYYSKDEKLLVYDYMPMGSLSSLLHGNRGSGRTPLNWETRSSIALAAARGIEYIHSMGATASHGNIKSSNILLGKSYEARVSDHGLALLAGPTPASNRVAGYRAPEVTDARRISQKADVYSFGVLLLELLTGKAPAQALLNEEGVDLPRWVQSVVREEWTSEVFDLELLRYQNVEEDMVQLLQLAIDCANQYPDRRPQMAEVVVRIEEIRRSSLASAEKDQQQYSNQNVSDADDQSD